MSALGAADVDSRLEEQLIDGILYAFQEQTNEASGVPLPPLPPSLPPSCFLLGCSGAECLWGGGKCSWHSGEALPAPDLWYHPLEAEQQGSQGPPAGGRPHITHR